MSVLVLACVEPEATDLVARALGVSRPTVALWRRRFAEHRLEGLVDAPRRGAPGRIDDEAVERLIVLTQGGDADRRDALEHAVDGQAGL